MNTERLITLAVFLEHLDPDRFDFDRWATGDLVDCGTKACALGWATQIPEFAAAGLRLDTALGAEWCVVYAPDQDTARWAISVSLASAMAFFDLEDYEARQLFAYTHVEFPNTPYGRAQIIRKMVAECMS